LTAEPEVTQAGLEPEPRRFRQVLGHFCTGVTVITALVGDAEPVGFACQSFAAVSLEPPLVLFCPSRSSATWPRIERAGHFCANVLTDGQRELSRRFGISAATGADKFAGLRWRACSSGAPVLEGALTWIGCAIEAVHEAGDHFVVIGRVIELGECAATRRSCSTEAATPRGSERPRKARPRWSTPSSPGPATPTGCSPPFASFTSTGGHIPDI
jgi:3-hydroxy-9,10-secoandrosta-1,3,5(10)-triene-9,17-dione monooxygenase reductase component